MSFVPGSPPSGVRTVKKPVEGEVRNGRIYRVPDDCKTVEEAIGLAGDGDCVFIAPGVYEVAEPMMVTKDIYIMGVDETGECAVLKMDGGRLRPALPIIRFDTAKSHIKGVQFDFSYDKYLAAPGADAKSFALLVVTGFVVMDEVSITSETGGIRCAPGSHTTLVCSRITTAKSGVAIEGTAFLDRSTFMGCASGVEIHAEPACSAKVEGCCFSQCGVGISCVGRGSVRCERSAFVDGTQVGVRLINSGLSSPVASLIRSNEFRGVAHKGVEVGGDGCSVTVSKNFIHSPGKEVVGACGVHVAGGRPEIQTNVVQSCPNGPGILCTGGTPLIESNVVEECAVGIHIRSARPMVRLNEITSSTISGVLVESAQLPLLGVYRSGPDDTRPSAHSDDAGSTGFVNPMHEADPHVEANVMADNQRNICVYSCTGTFLKNELTVSADDNVVLDGPQSVAVVVSGNVIGGSMKGACVLLSNKVEARIQGNEMRGAQQAAVVMRGCGFSEVQRNTGEECQGGVTAMGGAVGRISGNVFGTGMEIEIFSDSQATVAVV